MPPESGAMTCANVVPRCHPAATVPTKRSAVTRSWTARPQASRPQAYTVCAQRIPRTSTSQGPPGMTEFTLALWRHPAHTALILFSGVWIAIAPFARAN